MKKRLSPIGIGATIVFILLLGIVVYLYSGLKNQEQINKDMQELAEMDKKEMEKEYMEFSEQYSEMRTKITNDSIIAQLTQEQERTKQLLEELRNVKSNDAREIARLKKELATCRAVIRNYVLQIDSLNRLNQNLRDENNQIRGQYDEATRQIEGLNNEKSQLNEKVAIAAQLDATSISMTALTEKGKAAKNLKKTRSFQISFNIAKNVTAAAGNKTVYIRVNTPNGGTLAQSGTFSYENKQIQFSARKQIEYNGQETPVSLYCNANETLVAGSYKVSIFCDGHMIGSRSFNFN